MKHISESIIGKRGGISLNKRIISDGDVLDLGYNSATHSEIYYIYLSPDMWKKYSGDNFHTVGSTGMMISPEPQFLDGYSCNNFDRWDNNLMSLETGVLDIIGAYKASKRDLLTLKAILNVKDHREKGYQLQKYIDNIIRNNKAITR